MDVSEYKIPRERQRDNCTLQKRGDGQTGTRNMEKRASVRDNMLPFKARYFAYRRTIESLHYESKRCWANMA
jgi:hypothetical protein